MGKEVLFNIRVDANFTKIVQLDKQLVSLRKRRTQLIKLQKTENGITAQQQKELTALNLTIGQQTKEKAKLTREINKGNKARAKEITQFEKETKLASRLNKRLKDVILTKGATSREARRLAKRLQTVQTRLKNVNSSAKKMTGTVTKARKGFAGFRASLATAAVAATGAIVAIRGLIQFGAASIEKLGEQEKAEKALEIALGGTSQALLDQASALQRTTKFGDETTIQGQAFLAQLGLQEEQILRLTPSILDFAEAQGISANDAFKLVAKSVGSTTNALSRYGISIEGTAKSNDRVESAVTALSTAFDGQAEAAASVGTGAITQLGNRLGDLQEKFGKFLVSGINPVINNASLLGKILDDVAQGLDVLNGDVESSSESFSVLGNIIGLVKGIYTALFAAIRIFLTPLRLIIEGIGRLAERFGLAGESGSIFSDVMISVQEVIVRLPKIIDIIADEIIQAFERIVDVARGLKDIIFGIFTFDLEQAKKGFSEVADALGNAFEDVTGDIAKRIKALFDPNSDDNKKTKKKSKDLGKAIAIGLIEGVTKEISKLQELISKAITEEDIIVLRAKLELEQKELKRLQELGKKEEITFQIKIDSELDKKLRDINDKLSEEQNKIEPVEIPVEPKVKGLTTEQKQLIKDEAFKLGQDLADTAFNIQKQANERRKNFEIDQLTISNQRDRDVLQSRLDSGLISQAEFENNRLALEQKTADEREQIERAAFERKKNIDTAQAIINGALAITQSLANTLLPFPTSLIAPAAIAAGTALQVATIRSQKFKRGGVPKTGAMLQGRSHEQGGIPAIVGGSTQIEMEGGEAIINKKSTRKHLSLLSSINQDGGGVPLMARGGLPVPKIKYQGGGLSGIDPIDLRGIVEEVTKGVVSTIRVENVATETFNTALDVENLQSGLSN